MTKHVDLGVCLRAKAAPLQRLFRSSFFWILAAVAIFVIGLTAPPVWAQNTVQTIAGGGPNNLPVLKSSLGSPVAINIDAAGNVYVADLYSERIFKVDTTGNVTVVAGTGARAYYSGDGGPAISANLTYPSGVAVDSVGNIFIADRTYCRIRKVAAPTGIISTVAGTGTCWYSGDGGPATSATLNDPSDVAVDSTGNIFIADTWNCLVRKVSSSTGIISTLAGTLPDTTGLLHCGYSGDGGLATSAELRFPNSLAVDGSGNIFIADTTNCAIRKISASSSTISTVAGTGSCGYSGDGGLATSAQLSQPYGLAVDRSGNIFIADTVNCLVREVSVSNSHISTVSGNYSLGCGYSGDGTSATSAQLNQPYGVAVDGSGDIFIADYKNSVIRGVSATTGNISTFAGVAVPDPNHVGKLIGLPAYSGDGYAANNAELSFLNDSPWAAGMAVDRSGNVFIADSANHAIRKVSASTGIITTAAGNGLIGYAGDGGPATSAQLFYPRDVAVDGSGNIYIVDSGNCVIRKITASTGVITTVAGTLPDSSGNYYCGYSGDGGPATSAELYPIDLTYPAGGVAVDSSGNIFIADTGNGVIREVSASTGIITTVAGIANSIYVGGGDGGPATSATLYYPYGVAVDSAGNIFIADTREYAIREVMAVNGNIYTIAGNIALGLGFSGDGGPAGLAQLRNIYGLFLDPAGNLFIPDPDNCVIREVSASTGNIATVAGTFNRNGSYYCGYAGDGGPALSAIFNAPSAAGADTSGDLVVLDGIRVRTVAGLVQGPAAAAVPFPNPLAFPTEPLGTSNTLTLMLSDRGSLATSVSTVAISGTNASDFSETDNCVGRSLAAGGGSCAINVKFNPSVAATESALLTMTDTVGTQSVVLTGTGVAPPGFSPSPPTISFGQQQETIKSFPIGVTVTNNGNSGLTISSIAISGANANDFTIGGTSCSGLTVAVSSTCVVNVTFAPSTTGAETASLKFTDDAPGSPQSVGLTGTGTDFSIGLAPGGSAAATVAAGSAATFNLRVTPISGFNGTVALTCTGAPQKSTCMPSEPSAIPNGNTAATFSVQVTTTAHSIATPGVGRQWRPFDGLRILPIILMVALASTLLAFASRFRGAAAQRRRAYVLAIPLGFLALAIILIGCGGGGANSSPVPPPPSSGTPTGNYTLTITGTSNGVSHSQTLVLTVN
jgi:trimeric autotransporter adhesin